MMVFGLLSSVNDYLTSGLILFLVKEDEKIFQTGWFTESVISATLIVLFVLAISPMPFAGLFGFIRPPLSFYRWMLLIITTHIFRQKWPNDGFISKSTIRSKQFILIAKLE